MGTTTMDDVGAGAWVVMAAGMATIAIVILVAVWLVVRDGARRDPALAELRTRYARGEIDREEYDQRRTALAASGASDAAKSGDDE